MNLKQLREFTKDLPDTTEIGSLFGEDFGTYAVAAKLHIVRFKAIDYKMVLLDPFNTKLKETDKEHIDILKSI